MHWSPGFKTLEQQHQVQMQAPVQQRAQAQQPQDQVQQVPQQAIPPQDQEVLVFVADICFAQYLVQEWDLRAQDPSPQLHRSYQTEQSCNGITNKGPVSMPCQVLAKKKDRQQQQRNNLKPARIPHQSQPVNKQRTSKVKRVAESTGDCTTKRAHTGRPKDRPLLTSPITWQSGPTAISSSQRVNSGRPPFTPMRSAPVKSATSHHLQQKCPHPSAIRRQHQSPSDPPHPPRQGHCRTRSNKRDYTTPSQEEQKRTRMGAIKTVRSFIWQWPNCHLH